MARLRNCCNTVLPNTQVSLESGLVRPRALRTNAIAKQVATLGRTSALSKRNVCARRTDAHLNKSLRSGAQVRYLNGTFVCSHKCPTQASRYAPAHKCAV